MSLDRHNSGDSLGESPREAMIGELINDFFDRRESGENLSQEDFLAEHPEHADELRAHLDGLDLLEGLGSSSLHPIGPDEETHPAAGSSAAAPRGGSAPLPVVPGYEIVKQIGRGGMGVVYKAIQQSTKREVALKLLLEGPLASEQSRRRFEREIALAAQLRHPNIIPIYDSGSFDGRMYYAMEYVRGAALNEYLKKNELDIAARLALFNEICKAIGHAHQRGIVHRDMKPSNIIVAVDGKPHILDFGLAKAATYADITTSVTAQIIGTPAYMSPEQAAGDPSGIDIRTDVYSLGVVLYEMLTGRMPYETSGSMGKVLENIASAEPDPPGRHDKKIDGDLSAIVTKALEKNKDDRYQSLDTFGGDVSRYLAEEPISVKPASGAYLLRKALWKHRRFVGMIGMLFLIGTLVSWIVLKTGRDLKDKQDQLAQADSRVQEKVRELAAQEARAADLQRQRDEAERQRQAYEALLRTIDPRMAESLKNFTAAMADNPSLVTALPALLPTAPGETPAPRDADSEGPTKNPLLDLDEPWMSPKPDRLRSVPPQKPSEPSALVELGKGMFGLNPPKKTPRKFDATTQPATTQPVTTQPVPTTADQPTSRPVGTAD
ncbi:MAG: serine/threonine protein kinase [Phycisphaerae bacterium]